MEATFVIGQLLAALGGSAFLVACVGLSLALRVGHSPSPVSRLAVWAALSGFYSVVSIAQNILAAQERIDAVVYKALNASIAVMGLAGNFFFLSFLAHLVWGHDRWRTALGVFHAAAAVGVVSLNALWPAVVSVGPWRAQLVYEPTLPAALGLGVVLLFGLPPFLGVPLLTRVLRRVELEPTRRYRVRMLQASCVAWSGSVVFGVAAFLTESALIEVVTRLAYVGMGLTLYWAYAPPLWARRRWNLASLAEERALTVRTA